MKFKVTIALPGDVLSRYLLRLAEGKQSLGIIEQLIDDIPPGPVNVGDEGKVIKPDKDAVYGSIEGMIQHFELVMTNRGWETPVAEVYAANETANGEPGFSWWVTEARGSGGAAAARRTSSITRCSRS